MTGQCCRGGRTSRRLTSRLSTTAASILPGALLVLLPKCPLCLAAWLAAATGVSFSAAGAAWVRGMLAVVCVAAATLALAPMMLQAWSSRLRIQRCPSKLSRSLPQVPNFDAICPPSTKSAAPVM